MTTPFLPVLPTEIIFEINTNHDFKYISEDLLWQTIGCDWTS